MRQKWDSQDSSAYKCCFCIHVRIGTILLGICQMLIHVLVLACLIHSSLHPELMEDNFQTVDVTITEKNDDYDFKIESETPSLQFRKENMCYVFALLLCTFLVAFMLVYGAVRSRPSYLVPFFCLQVFDFCLTCLWVVGYMTYSPDIKAWIVQQSSTNYPGMDDFQKRLLSMDDQWLMLLLVIIFVLILTVKAYLINMVWACYRYLQVRNASRSVVREYTVDPDNEMLLPPKYEEVLNTPASPPPPPYTA